MLDMDCVLCGVGATYICIHTHISSGSPVSIPDQSMWDLCWTEWLWDRFLSAYFGFRLSVSCHQCSKLIIIYMLLLPERQTDEAWEPSKQRCSIPHFTPFFHFLPSKSVFKWLHVSWFQYLVMRSYLPRTWQLLANVNLWTREWANWSLNLYIFYLINDASIAQTAV
jgi:hypothetical protein